MRIMDKLGGALCDVMSEVYMYTAPPKAKPPYIVFAPDGANDFNADGVHSEKAVTGTIDLYMSRDNEQTVDDIEEALDSLQAGHTFVWYLNSVQYETSAGAPSSGYSGLVHYEWVFEGGGGHG